MFWTSGANIAIKVYLLKDTTQSYFKNQILIQLLEANFQWLFVLFKLSYILGLMGFYNWE